MPDSVLGAVAEVVLPSELDPDARSRVVAEFAIWIRDFAPVAEQVHGYGSQEIRYGPPDPFPAWTAQLDGLDAEARARHRVGFADLALEDRRALLEAALRAADGSLGDRPDALEADHVAVGLLGYFYGSAEAVNLCYERRIDPRACRPLETSGDRPAPLAVRTAASGQAHRRLAERSTPPGAAFERGLEPGS